MATYSKRGKKWLCEVKKDGVRTSKSFTKKYDAQQWSSKIEQSIENGEYHKAERLNITVEQACDKYITTVTVKKKGAVTEQQRFDVIKRFKDLMALNMGKVEGHHIATFRDCRLKTVKPATINRDLNLLGHVFSVAIKDWSLPISNPVQSIRRPKVPSSAARDRRLLTGEEERLLRACKQCSNIYLKPIVSFAIETGMRRGELVALIWENVDIDGRSVFVPDTKTDTPRTVPLSTHAIKMLNSLPHHISGLVFPFPSGNSVSVEFNRACKRSMSLDNKEVEPLEDLRLQDMRHEATSRFFELGLNIMQVSAITGHKTLQMLKRYTHLKTEDLAKLLG